MPGISLKKLGIRYDPLSRIRHEARRKRLQTVKSYQQDLYKWQKRQPHPVREELDEAIRQVDGWIEEMYDLALHIDGFEGNELIERDKKLVPLEIEKVKFQIVLTDKQLENQTLNRDNRVYYEQKLAELKRRLKLLEQQQANLTQTIQNVYRAKTQFEIMYISVEEIHEELRPGER